MANMAYEHAGHRRRMSQKLTSGCLHEYEVLEMALYSILPRKNTCDLAHRLLACFGSISGVYNAEIEELLAIRGIGERAAVKLRGLGAAFRDYAKPRTEKAQKAQKEPTMQKAQKVQKPFSSLEFTRYVREAYKNIPYEVLDIYTLASNGLPTNKLRYTDFSPYEVALPASEFNRLLIDEKPTGIVLVHNHVDGASDPSAKDEHLTKCVQVICNMYGIILCDHIISAPNSSYSYYLSGRLGKMSKEYSMDGLIKKGDEKIERKEK